MEETFKKGFRCLICYEPLPDSRAEIDSNAWKFCGSECLDIYLKKLKQATKEWKRTDDFYKREIPPVEEY